MPEISSTLPPVSTVTQDQPPREQAPPPPEREEDVRVRPKEPHQTNTDLGQNLDVTA